MKNSIACCYLTHNHPDIVKDVLDRSLKDYVDHGIDVCIYDDSDDELTKQLIESYRDEYDGKLYYVDVHAAVHADHKMLLIQQGYGLPKDYDYIWPVKDRVCFTASYLDKLCEALDKDPDVIIGCNETQRWDVSRPINRDIYKEPVELCRNYCFVSTNWEATIKRRSTMLTPIDWDRYDREYSVNMNNSFVQLISMYVRFSEMDSMTAMIVHYEPEERYIAQFGGSSWRDVMFNTWIDRWTAAIFSLPSIYDPYKLEIIKSETNLFEVMGSVEHMMDFHAKGIFTREVFEKYINVWPVVTDIPVEWLELIVNDEFEQVIMKVMEAYDAALAEHDYLKSCNLISANRFFSQMYDATTYHLLVACYNRYRSDMLNNGESIVFDGISSVEDLKVKFSAYL